MVILIIGKTRIPQIEAPCQNKGGAGSSISGLYICGYYPVTIKGVLHPWALFLKTLCIFSQIKATSDKVSYGSGQKFSKELKNHSFTSVQTIVVKLPWKMCENQYFPYFEP